MRSLNNNVFKFSSYWRNWSRILFHDTADTAQNNPIIKMRKQYNIPAHVHTIELDLTAINPDHINDWRSRVQHANIRCHCTPMVDRDIITGEVPLAALIEMDEWLTPDAIDVLLHADLLPYIDFDLEQKVTNGGAHFIDCYQRPVTPQQYLAAVRRDGGGPGILMHDVQGSYDALVRDWDAKIAKMIIHNGLRVRSE